MFGEPPRSNSPDMASLSSVTLWSACRSCRQANISCSPQIEFEDWLNDAVKGFLHGEDSDRRLVLEHKSLRVFAASPKYLLAMKLLSARVERDADDIALLLDLSGIATQDETLDVVEAAYGRGRMPAKTAILLEAILADRS